MPFRPELTTKCYRVLHLNSALSETEKAIRESPGDPPARHTKNSDVAWHRVRLRNRWSGADPPVQRERTGTVSVGSMWGHLLRAHATIVPISGRPFIPTSANSLTARHISKQQFCRNRALSPLRSLLVPKPLLDVLGDQPSALQTTSAEALRT